MEPSAALQISVTVLLAQSDRATLRTVTRRPQLVAIRRHPRIAIEVSGELQVPHTDRLTIPSGLLRHPERTSDDARDCRWASTISCDVCASLKPARARHRVVVDLTGSVEIITSQLSGQPNSLKCVLGPRLPARPYFPVRRSSGACAESAYTDQRDSSAVRAIEPAGSRKPSLGGDFQQAKPVLRNTPRAAA